MVWSSMEKIALARMSDTMGTREWNRTTSASGFNRSSPSTPTTMNGSSALMDITTRMMLTSRMDQQTTSEPPSAYPSETHAIIIATLFIVCGVIGMSGNFLVLVAVAMSRKLQTATNAFVVNLSISDFLMCFTMQFQAAAVLSSDGWPMSNATCEFVSIMTIITPMCSVLTLAMIAINRYTLITKNKKTYQKIYRTKIIAILVAFTWCMPFVTFVIPQLTPLGSLGYDPFYRICKWVVSMSKIPIFQGITALTFLLSTAVIIFCYFSIYLHVRKHIKDMKAKRMTHVMTMSSINCEEQSTLSQAPRSPTTRNMNGTPSLRQVKITKNLCCVVIVFFICVVPHSLLMLFQVRHLAITYIAVVFILSSNINPMLYAAKHPDFRMVFSRMFRCNYQDMPGPSRCLKCLILQANVKASTHTSSESSR